MLPLSWSRKAIFAAAVAGALVVTGCAGQKPKPRLAYIERPVELLYATGADRLDARRWADAISYFEEVERQHPYSEWSRRAILMTAYANYQANNYADAIENADRFINLYPGNPSTPYAYYLKAICYFEQIVDVGRDQAATEQALVALRDVQLRFPKSEYAVDATYKLDMVYDQLAGKEMEVGRWYLREGQTIAAIGRFRTVIDKYQTTSHAPEALYRLIEAYLTVGLVGEAQRTGAMLGYNFRDDPWYGEGYRLLTDKGLQPAVAPLTPGAKRSILQRVTGLGKNKGQTIAPPAETNAPAPSASAPGAPVQTPEPQPPVTPPGTEPPPPTSDPIAETPTPPTR
ncbi:Outer membrane protein assembly factor BamD [Caulobacter sp. NIBR1757]|nr:Outer membrane protein assembly factor BamD [Caulobacter sp. NIBR1757]